MGKALLVLVLGAGLVLTKQLYNATQHEAATAEDQTEYREEVIAREIAQSAFNVGMGEVRSAGEQVQEGARLLNGADNSGRSGEHTTGRFAGGSYTVRAELTSGHSVRVVATGTYGEAEYTMHDEYRVPVLTARVDGLVDVSFLESQAGYCSAVFYQAYTLGMPEGTVPEPIMLFAPDNRDRRTARQAQTIYVEAGTQMNFFIAVDQNCSERFEASLTECEVREEAQDYKFDASDFDYVHYGLTVEAGNLDQASETAWAFIEQHPTDRQRWRIAWEDLRRTDWESPGSEASDDPARSVYALKMHGYDGIGWPTSDSWGYRTLRDYGNRPDFSDQVIEIEVISTTDSSFYAAQEAARAQQAACGEDVDEQVVDNPAGSTDEERAAEQTESGSPPSDEAIDSSDGYSSDELTAFACDCTSNGTKNNKTAILHRPPGNESNEQLLCVGNPSVPSHFDNHNDVFPTCNTRQNVRNNNGKNKN